MRKKDKGLVFEIFSISFVCRLIRRILIIAVVYVGFVVAFPTIRTNDASRYEELMSHSKKYSFKQDSTWSYLMSFPTSTPKNITYFYYYYDTMFGPFCIMLEAKYDKDEYEIEKKRLKSMTFCYEEQSNKAFPEYCFSQHILFYTYLKTYCYDKVQYVYECVVYNDDTNTILWFYDNDDDGDAKPSDSGFDLSFSESKAFNMNIDSNYNITANGGTNNKVFDYYEGYSVYAFQKEDKQYIPSRSEISIKYPENA